LINAVLGLVLGLVVGWIVTSLAAPADGPASVRIWTLAIVGLSGLLLGQLFGDESEGLLGAGLSSAVLSAFVWVVLGLSLAPLISQGEPAWSAEAAGQKLPQLTAVLISAGLTGMAYFALSRFMRLSGQQSGAEDAPDPIRVVILGGGYAGVSAAETLDQLFLNDARLDIHLLSQTNYLLHTPMLSEVSASAVSPQNISPSLRSFFRRVKVKQCEVARIDYPAREVHIAGSDRSRAKVLPFDHLILAVGGVPNFFGNAAVEAEAFTFKSLDDAMVIRNQIIDMFERADDEPDVDRRRQMLTFVVAGGGFAGVELVGGINDFCRGIIGFYPHVHPDDPRIVLIHSRDRILPELSASLAEFAREKLEARGVEFQLERRVSDAARGQVSAGDLTIPTETFIWTAGNRPHPIMASLNLPLTGRGQLEVGADLAAAEAPGLWAVGDCAQIPDLTTGGSCPPTAQHAVRQGKLAAKNVAATIHGKPLKNFRFKMLGQLAALGHQLAVAEVFGRRFSGFLAWLLWRSIYLAKLPTFEKQVRVGLDWLLDIFFPADIVQTMDFSRPAPQPADETHGGAQ
jgi:NADH dehydrogenase